MDVGAKARESWNMRPANVSSVRLQDSDAEQRSVSPSAAASAFVRSAEEWTSRQRRVYPIKRHLRRSASVPNAAETERKSRMQQQRRTVFDLLPNMNDVGTVFSHGHRITIPEKDWSEVGVSVYRVGVGMYHSSIVVDNIEWHFWEGVGVQALQRYFDEAQRAVVSVSHVPFVEYVPIDTLMVTPQSIASLCLELGASVFSTHTYDILRCNCNHFTAGVLQRLGLESKMPQWINRTLLPFVRTWIDTILNRKTVINRDTPDRSSWQPLLTALETSGYESAATLETASTDSSQTKSTVTPKIISVNQHCSLSAQASMTASLDSEVSFTSPSKDWNLLSDIY